MHSYFLFSIIVTEILETLGFWRTWWYLFFLPHSSLEWAYKSQEERSLWTYVGLK
jgi:hypothetical protein